MLAHVRASHEFLLVYRTFDRPSANKTYIVPVLTLEMALLVNYISTEDGSMQILNAWLFPNAESFIGV